MRKKRTPKDKKMGMVAINSRAETFLPKARHEPGLKRCFVIDAMHLTYRAHYAHHNFKHKGRPTSIIFGVINMLKSIIFQENPEKLIMCWDGNNHPKRVKLLPDYRSSRKKKRDPEERKSFMRQVKTVQMLLYYMGIPQVYNENVEGDDMVYLVTKSMGLLYPITILSGDKDFKQLINKDVMLRNPNDRYGDSWQDFYLHTRIEINQFVDYLCLTGDKTDDIPGYGGIGDARAVKFLNMYGSIRNYLRDKKAEFSGISDRKALLKVYKRNKRLIDLKWFNERYHTAKDIIYFKNRRNPKFNAEKANRLFMKYGLKTFMFQSFQKPFIKLQEN